MHLVPIGECRHSNSDNLQLPTKAFDFVPIEPISTNKTNIQNVRIFISVMVIKETASDSRIVFVDFPDLIWLILRPESTFEDNINK